MTSIAEIIKIVSSLIPQYDGSVDKLPAVLSALAALSTLITDANRAAAIQVVLSRLEGKARVAVGDNPATINAIVQSLKEKCDKRPQPETIVAKLNATKQSGDINQFVQKVETLTLELEKCYLAENVPVDTATKLATRAGVKALTAGVRSSETKTILKAGQFNTIASALEKAIENEPVGNNQNNPQIMYTKRGFPSRGRGRGGMSNRGRANYSQRSNYHTNQYQRDNRFQNFNSNRGNYQNRRFSSQRGNYHNNGNNSRVYYNSGNPQFAQQNQGQPQMQEPQMHLGFQQPIQGPQPQSQQQNQVALAQLMPRR